MAVQTLPSSPDRVGPWTRATAARCTLAACERQREVAFGLFLMLCYGFFYQVPLWNEPSRYNLVRAILDDSTLQIDRYHQNTGDKAYFGGHYYSDKLPGSSLLALPTYALIRAAVGLGIVEPPDDRAVLHALTFTAAGLPSVVTALLLLRFLRSLTSEVWAWTITVGYALGTMAFPFATMYFGHAASTAFLFAAFYLLWTMRQEDRPWRALAAGACAGLGVLTELPVALGVLVLLGYCAWIHSRRLPTFALGGLPPALTLLGYNWLAFEHPLRLGYHYAVHFADANRRGLGGVAWPTLTTFVELLAAPRGLFRLSPWLVLAPLGLLALQCRRIRPEVTVSSLIVFAFLVYNSGYFNPFGGASPGPRYLTPTLPFAAILVALAPPMLRAIAELGILASIALVLAATATMPNALEIVRDPLADEWLPRLIAGDLADSTAWHRWGLTGLWPLGVLGFGALAAAVAVVGSAATSRTHCRFAFVGLVTLAMLVLSLAVPLSFPWPRSAIGPTPAEGDIVVRDAGLTVGVEGGARLVARPWARLENRADDSIDAIVRFTIETSSGERVWVGDHGTGRWPAGERRRLGLIADMASRPPGEYFLSVVVRSHDGRTLASRERLRFRYAPL